MKTFRFDDICGNSKYKRDEEVALAVKSVFPNARIIFGVSPLTHAKKQCNERIYPHGFNPLSDVAPYFKPVKCWVPTQRLSFIEFAGHGLWHFDHRLMAPELAEASIITSCALVKAKIFIPPHNYWTEHMDMVCRREGIELIKFEDNWLSIEHNEFDPNHQKWYLHARHWTPEKILEYLHKKQ